MNTKEKPYENLKIAGIDTRDYPDFCDAYLESGWHVEEDRELTEDELDSLTDLYAAEIQQALSEGDEYL